MKNHEIVRELRRLQTRVTQLELAQQVKGSAPESPTPSIGGDRDQSDDLNEKIEQIVKEGNAEIEKDRATLVRMAERDRSREQAEESKDRGMDAEIGTDLDPKATPKALVPEGRSKQGAIASLTDSVDVLSNQATMDPVLAKLIELEARWEARFNKADDHLANSLTSINEQVADLRGASEASADAMELRQVQTTASVNSLRLAISTFPQAPSAPVNCQVDMEEHKDGLAALKAGINESVGGLKDLRAMVVSQQAQTISSIDGLRRAVSARISYGHDFGYQGGQP